MEITCAQMDVLISFYLEGDLSSALKKKVEEHLEKCSTCRAKFSIIKTMLDDLKTTIDYKNTSSRQNDSNQYKNFEENLSAYIDNELTENESIKIKKFTINNKNARKDLEDTYQIRKLMSESFDKSQLDVKQDFSKKIMKQITPNEESYAIHPVLKFAIGLIVSVLILSTIIIISLIF